MSLNTVTKCPKCGCSAYSLDGTYLAKLKGQAEKVRRSRGKCKYCGRRFTLDPIIRTRLTCPQCGNTHIRKMGFTKTRLQKYKCIKCCINFQEGARAHRLTDHVKKMVTVYIGGGYSERFVAKLLGIGSTTVRRIIGKVD